jgi:crossover junction endodeoxyribonuclease RuvC
MSERITIVSITPRQYQQLQERLEKGQRAPRAAAESVDIGAVIPQPRERPGRHEIILGIDPSLRGTGYGVVRCLRRGPELMVEGTIKCPSAWERSRCLARIAETLREIIRTCRPTVCVVEGLFYAQNLQTALIMGEARGASLVAVAEAALEVYEIAPRKVKQAIVGYGAAQKLAVAKMVQRMLGLAQPPAPDAADALALALSYAQESRSPISRISRRI